MPLEDVEKLDLKGIEALDIPSTNPNEGGRAIPLLREFVGLASDADARLALELKASNRKRSCELARRVIDQLADLRDEGGLGFRGEHRTFLEDKLVLQSFSANALRSAAERGRERRLGLRTTLYWPSSLEWANKVPTFDWDRYEEIAERETMDWNDVGLAIAQRNGMNEIEFIVSDITPELVEKVHAHGLKIGASVVADAATAQRFREMGVDYFLTE